MSQNREYAEEEQRYRTRDRVTALLLVPGTLLLIWLLLGGPSVKEVWAAAGGFVTEAVVAVEGAVPEADVVQPTAEAEAEVAAVETAPTAEVPTPEVPDVQPTIPAPTVEEAGVLSPSDFFVDPAAVAAGWVAEQVPGTPIDPNFPGGFAGLPPHLQALFDDGQAAKEDAAAAIGLNPQQAQLNVIPLAALVAMYNAAGLNDVSAQFDSLKELLSARPDTVANIPVPPIFGNAGQGYIANPTFIDFQGGSGIGYVAHIGQEVGPIANDNGFTYVFQGLTADGAQYIVGVWPLNASFLPATVTEVSQEMMDALAADPNTYVSSMLEAVNSAADSDFTPSLSALQTVLAGLVIGQSATAANEAATATDIVAAPSLTNTVWQWTAFQDTAGVNDISVENPENYTLTMLDDGAYLLQADCNTGSGKYDVDGARIKFHPGPMTRAFCPEGSLDTTFLNGIFHAVTFVYDDSGNLVLNLFADAGNMVFANGGAYDMAASGQEQPAILPPADPAIAGLVGSVLTMGSFTGPDGETVTVDNPENYSLTLNPDGTYSVVADCNTGGGAYAINDGQLILSPAALTMMACPEGSQADAFLALLAQPATVSADESGSPVLDFGDGGNIVFNNNGPAAEAAVPGLIGATLYWVGSVSSDGSSVAVENPGNYSLTLNPDGTYNFIADCNSGGGSYTIENGQIVFGPAFMTMMACPEGSQADAFLALLAAPLAYTVDETGSVLLTAGDGATNATFDTSQPDLADTGLTGYYWTWASYDAPEGEDDVTVGEPGNYALVFRPDGTYFIKADCNVGNGSFAVEGDQIQINPGALTMALCPPESQDAQFLSLLFTATTYAINDNGELVLALENGGTMVFGNGGMADDPAAVEESVAAPQNAAEAAGITGFTFNWTGSTNADGQAVTVDNPQNYNFVLNPDGTLSIQADCNRGFGAYTLNDDGTVSFNVMGLTMAYCGPESQSDQFLSTLLAITNYEFNESGDIVFTTADGSVATFGNVGPAEAAATTPAAEEFQGIVWQWASFTEPTGANDLTVATPENYTLTLFPDGTYHIQADCNVVNGAYTFEANTLTLLPGPSTLAACGDESLDSVYLGYLFQPLLVSLMDVQLILDLPVDAGTLVFNNGGAAEAAAEGQQPSDTSQPAPAIVGTAWQWVSFTDAKQSFNVADPALYTVEFMADGSVVAKLDCNQGMGAFTPSGDSGITISLTASTRAACAEGSLGTTFQEYLNQAAIYSINNGVMRLDLIADGGTMTFYQIP